jgi:hypothetical protein
VVTDQVNSTNVGEFADLELEVVLVRLQVAHDLEMLATTNQLQEGLAELLVIVE